MVTLGRGLGESNYFATQQVLALLDNNLFATGSTAGEKTVRDVLSIAGWL